MLLNIAGGSDLGLFEVNEAASIISKAAHPDANIIFGAVVDDTLGDEVRVTVIAAGFDRWGQREAEEISSSRRRRSSRSRPSARRRSRVSSAGRAEPEEKRLVFDADETLDIPSFLRNE